MAEIRTVSYVPASEMFEDCPTIETAFREADHGNVSWGDAAHTLISLREFLSMIYLDNEEMPAEEVKTFRQRVRLLKLRDPYIDLEN